MTSPDVQFDGLSLIAAGVGVGVGYWYGQDPGVGNLTLLLGLGVGLGALGAFGWYWGRWKDQLRPFHPSLARATAFLAAAIIIATKIAPLQVVALSGCGGWLLVRAFQPRSEDQDT